MVNLAMRSTDRGAVKSHCRITAIILENGDNRTEIVNLGLAPLPIMARAAAPVFPLQFRRCILKPGVSPHTMPQTLAARQLFGPLKIPKHSTDSPKFRPMLRTRSSPFVSEISTILLARGPLYLPGALAFSKRKLSRVQRIFFFGEA